MPPASPAPGWSSGLVCTESVATRRGVPERERRRAGTCNLPLVWSGGRGRKRPPVDSPSCNSARMSFMPGTDSSHSPDRRPLPGAGRTAVVTGASSGIGAATATRLAAEGFDVVIGARRVDRLEALAGSIGARALPLDVTDEASVAAFAGALDRVDVLVNNAGGSFDASPVAEADLDSWARTFDVNVLGTVRLTKALLPALRAAGGGDVVFVGSTAGLVSYEGGSSYTAAKHGVHTLAETLRLELNGEPVRVVEIAPGMVRTEEFSLNRLGVLGRGRRGLPRGAGAPGGRRHRRLHRLDGHPAAPREHRPDGRAAPRTGRAAQSRARRLSAPTAARQWARGRA